MSFGLASATMPIEVISSPTPISEPTLVAASPTFAPPTTTSVPVITDDIKRFVGSFLYDAAFAETQTYLYNDLSYTARYVMGDPLLGVQELLDGFVDYSESQGEKVVPELDVEQSGWVDIRIIHEGKYEVDECDYWIYTYYDLSDESFIHADPAVLMPQTITLERLGADWYITKVAFFNPPSFCG
jgi:hypothetical protein